MARGRFVIHVLKRNFQEFHKVAALVKRSNKGIDNLNTACAFQVFTEQGIVRYSALVLAEDLVTLEELRTAQTGCLQYQVLA